MICTAQHTLSAAISTQHTAGISFFRCGRLAGSTIRQMAAKGSAAISRARRGRRPSHDRYTIMAAASAKLPASSAHRRNLRPVQAKTSARIPASSVFSALQKQLRPSFLPANAAVTAKIPRYTMAMPKAVPTITGVSAKAPVICRMVAITPTIALRMIAATVHVHLQLQLQGCLVR